MRNLKKVLSLSLAFVMLLGMMVMGSAVTALDVYPDAEDINYAEAVDLLTAIDVLKGDDKGFRPADTLDRDEAAKIIATVTLGVDAAEALADSVTVAPFSDVPANHWAAGYIAYCANVGIINGMGDGTFAPDAKVTGFQFAKMLLCCLGYGVNGEYTGSNWALNVSKDGVTTRLFDRLAGVNNAKLTREEAAQLAFNAIQLQTVSYSALYGEYIPYLQIFGQQTLLGTLAENIFKVDTTPVVDGYGYNHHFWHFVGNKAAITDTYLTDDILGTETDYTITAGAIYKAYDWDSTRDNDDHSGVEFIVNGTWMTSLTVTDGKVTGLTAGADESIFSDGLTEFKGSALKPFALQNGYAANFVDEDWDGDVDKVVVTFEALAEVTKVTEATAYANRKITLNVYDDEKTLKTTIECDEFEKGDMVLVTPASTLSADLDYVEILDIKLAETVEGKVNTFFNVGTTTVPSVTVNDVRYIYNGVYNAAGRALNFGWATTGYEFNNTYRFYLDSQGNVIGAKLVDTASADLVYITAIGEDAFEKTNIVTVLFADGTEGEYTLDPKCDYYDKTDRDTNSADGLRSADEGVGYIYGYTINEAGKINLTHLTGNYDAYGFADMDKNAMAKGYSGVTFTAGGYYDQDGTTGAGTVWADDNTEIFFITGTPAGTLHYTGKDNIPALDDAGYADKVAIATKVEGNLVYAEMIVINGSPKVVSQYKDFLYIVDSVGTHKNGMNTVYFYDVILDGELVRIAAKQSCLVKGDVYAYSFDANGFAGYDPDYAYITGLYDMEETNHAGGTHTGTVATFDDTVAVNPVNNNVVFETKGEYVISKDVEITYVGAPIETDASVKPGDQVTVVVDTQPGPTENHVLGIYITGYDKAYLASIDYDFGNTANDTLYSVTTIIAESDDVAAAFAVKADGTMTGAELVKLITATSDTATVSVHSSLADAQSNASAVTGALSDGTYYVRIATSATEYNVFSFALTINAR